MPTKKPTTTPKSPQPDLKSVTAAALESAATWMESEVALEDLFHVPATRRTTKAEWAVFEDARKLAVNYIRMGARQ